MSVFNLRGRGASFQERNSAALRKAARRRAVLAASIEPLESRLLLTAITWAGGTGNWNNPAQWVGNIVPVYGDSAVINSPGSVVDVTDNERSADITTSAGTTLHIAAGAYLYLDDGGTIAGTLTVDAASGLTSEGEIGAGFSTPLTLGGTTTMDGLFYQGDFTNNGTINANGASYNGGGALTNNGTLNINGGFGFGSNLNLVNAATGTVTLLDDSGVSGNGTISNSGTFTLNGGAGTATITGVQLQDLGGTISVQSGMLSDAATAYFESANFTIASGAAFAFDPISATNSSNDFDFSGTSTGSGAGHLLFDGATAYPGMPGAQAASAVLNFPAGLAQVSGTAFAGNNQDGPVFEITNSGSLNFVGSAQHGNLGLINSGTIQVSGTGDIGVSRAGAFTNESTGIIDFTADGSLISLGGNTAFTNNGTIEKTGGAGTSSIDFDGSDSGTTVDAQTGTLDFPAGYAFNNTSFIAATGATISLDDPDGNTDYLAGGTWTGSGGGHLLFASSNVAPGIPGVQAPSSILDFPSGFAQVSGGGFVGNAQDGPVFEITNNGFLNYVGSAQHANLGLLNSGTILVSGTGNLAIDSAGAFTNNSTGIINFQSDAGVINPGGNTAFTNDGLIEKTGGTGDSVIGVGESDIGFNDSGGGFNVQTGTLTLGDGAGQFAWTAGSINVATGATLDVDDDSRIFTSGTFSSTGGGAVTFTSGDWYGANTGYGQTTPSVLDFNPGAFVDQGGVFVDELVTNSGYIDMNGSNSLLSLDNTGTIVVNGPSFSFSGGNVQNAGVIDFTTDMVLPQAFGTQDNTGTIEKTGGSGTLDLSQVNGLSSTGLILDESGTLLLSQSRNLFDYSALVVPTGATYEASNGATITFPSGYTPLNEVDGTVILSGAGSAFTPLSGLKDLVGTLAVINGASFATIGSLTSTGTLRVGGNVTVNGAFTESGTPTLNFAVSGLPNASGAPLLSVSGATTLAGALSAEYTNAIGSNADAYTVANFASASGGSFASTSGVGPAFTVALHPTSVVLNGANLPIVNAQPDTYTVRNDSFLTTTAATGVLANDTDPNSRSLTASLLTNPSHGFVTLNPDGSFTYVPNNSFTGADTFTYYASDGAVTSHATTVTLNVGLLHPVFSNLTAPATITYGTVNETVGGTIGASGVYPPAGETVAVTLDGVTQNATIGANGTFSTTFNTSTLPVSLTAYGITYSYAGDSGFYPASDTATTSVTVDKATAPIVLGNLSQTYDGSAEYATATTTPPGLTVQITYAQNNAAVAAPTNAGSYAVTATIVSSDYQGSATGTLVISEGVTSLVFGGTANDAYNGSAQYVTATTTSPAGLSGVSIAYTQNGAPVANPTNPGTYLVTATLNNPDYTAPPIQENLVISDSGTSLVFGGAANVTYDGNAHTITATTTAPAGLSGVSISYTENGTPVANPTSAGTYVATATLNNSDYTAAPIQENLVIAKAPPTFSGLSAPSSITAGAASVTFSGTIAAGSIAPPAGETVSVTLNGVTQNATIGGGGTFSTTFNTTSLPNSSTPYPLTYAYAGDGNFAVASNNSSTTLTVNSAGNAPVILANPLSTSVAPSGSLIAASFSATAEGLPFAAYQWQVSTNGGVTFVNDTSDIATQSGYNLTTGQFTATLDMTAKASQNGYEYRVIFTNSNGSATSTAAVLTVTGGATASAAPVVTLNPLSQTVPQGSTVTFTAAATGTPAPTVQWQVSPTNAGYNFGTFSNIPGATSTAYSVLATAANTNYEYRAVFTNSAGSVDTAAATLSESIGPGVTLNPVTQNITSNGTATFEATATGLPAPTVQWQGSATGAAGTFANLPTADFTMTQTAVNVFIPNGLESTDTVLTLPASTGDRYVRAVFTNSVGSVTSTMATVTETVPAILVNPVSGYLAANPFGGSPTATLTATASGTPVPTVQWQASVDGAAGSYVNLPAADFTSLSETSFATTQSTLTISQSSGYVYFRAVFTNLAGTATSNVATLTPVGTPVIKTNPISQTAAPGQRVTFTAAASASPSPMVQWQVSSNGIAFSNIAGATSTTYSVTAATTLNGYEYRAVFTNSAGAVATASATLTVSISSNPAPGNPAPGNPAPGTSAPIVTLDPASTTVVGNYSIVEFTAAATASPAATVQFQYSTTGAANSFVSYPSGDVITTQVGSTTHGQLILVDSTSNLFIRAVFTNIDGSATTTVASLIVGQPPVITVNPVSQSVLSGTHVQFGSNATNATSVQWQVSTNGGSTFTNIPGATGIVYGFTTTASENKYQYRAVFANSQGSDATLAAILTIAQPTKPVVTTNPAGGIAQAGVPMTFVAAASGQPTPSVHWQISTNNGASFANIAGATSTSYAYTPTLSSAGYEFRAVFTNSLGSATSAAATITTVYSVTDTVRNGVSGVQITAVGTTSVPTILFGAATAAYPQVFSIQYPSTSTITTVAGKTITSFISLGLIPKGDSLVYEVGEGNSFVLT